MSAHPSWCRAICTQAHRSHEALLQHCPTASPTALQGLAGGATLDAPDAFETNCTPLPRRSPRLSHSCWVRFTGKICRYSSPTMLITAAQILDDHTAMQGHECEPCAIYRLCGRIQQAYCLALAGSRQTAMLPHVVSLSGTGRRWRYAPDSRRFGIWGASGARMRSIQSQLTHSTQLTSNNR